jgi:hypothetical protein
MDHFAHIYGWENQITRNGIKQGDNEVKVLADTLQVILWF